MNDHIIYVLMDGDQCDSFLEMATDGNKELTDFIEGIELKVKQIEALLRSKETPDEDIEQLMAFIRDAGYVVSALTIDGISKSMAEQRIVMVQELRSPHLPNLGFPGKAGKEGKDQPSEH